MTMRQRCHYLFVVLLLGVTGCGAPDRSPPAGQAGEEREAGAAIADERRLPVTPYRNYPYAFSDDREEVLRRLAERRAKGPSDDELLEEISRAAFGYFWHEAHPRTGFIYDALSNRSSSSAATGFGLASLCVADFRGWITKEEARERVQKTLRAILEDPGWEHIEGLFYHWVDAGTGRWTGAEGMCLHDHVALICGVMVCREYFKGTEIEELADRILRMANWSFLTQAGKGTISERTGFLTNVASPDNHDWGGVVEYDGMKLDYLLPIGAAQWPVDPSYWDRWANTYQWGDYKGRYHRITRAALWIHQWDNCYLDLFCMRDAYADYFQNSVENTLANRQWCMDNGMYSAEAWGLTPTTGPNPDGDGTVYGNYGAPPPPAGSWQQGHVQDGTIAFTAAAGSLVFTPEESLLVLRYMWDELRDRMWGRYGFTTSFNLQKNWFSADYIGIDLGPVILAIENYRSGFVWKYFMRSPEVRRALNLAGFVGVVDNFDPMEHSHPYAAWSVTGTGSQLRRVEGYAFEGAHSLAIRPGAAPRQTRIQAQPLRRDFSWHAWMGLYVAGADARIPFEVWIVDGADRATKLDALPVQPALRAGEWELFVWKLPAPDTVNLEDIRKVVFAPLTSPARGELFVDHIFLGDDAPPGM